MWCRDYLSATTQLESQSEQSDTRIRQLDAAVEQLTSDTEAECALRERVATLEAKTDANIDSTKRWNDKVYTVSSAVQCSVV